MHTTYLRLSDLRPADLWFAGFWLATALALASNPVLAAEKNTASPLPKSTSIVKWVDEKGVTHYGDTVPAQYSGRDNSVLDQQGRIVKRNKAGGSQANKAVEEETKVSVEQKRHDNALLAAYTTEQEFDLARDRNLQMDEAAVQGLNQRMGSVKDRLAATKKIAAGFDQHKKPVPPHITQDLKENQDEIAKIEAQIAERQQNMDATRQRFEKDKQRFIELKRDPNAPPPPADTPAPAATPTAGPAPEAAKPISAAATAPVAPTATPAASATMPAPKPVPATTPKPVAEKPAAAVSVKKKLRVEMP